MNDIFAKACEFLRDHKVNNLTGIISTGSGQEIGFSGLNVKAEIPYSDIPGMSDPGLPGHEGMLRVIATGYGDWAVWTGRRHFYQGYSYDEIGLYIDISMEFGAKMLVCINAAGGLDPSLNVGDWVIADKYRSFIPIPVRGLSFDGGDWVSTSELLKIKLMESANQCGIKIHHGNYVGVPGPTYETASDVKWLRSLGCTLVGMSTVPELMRAEEYRMESISLSLIANVHGAGSELTHKEVVDAASMSAGELSAILSAFLMAN